jgi:hypothetical protein
MRIDVGVKVEILKEKVQEMLSSETVYDSVCSTGSTSCFTYVEATIVGGNDFLWPPKVSVRFCCLAVCFIFTVITLFDDGVSLSEETVTQ